MNNVLRKLQLPCRHGLGLKRRAAAAQDHRHELPIDGVLGRHG